VDIKTRTHHFSQCICGQTEPLAPSTLLAADPETATKNTKFNWNYR